MTSPSKSSFALRSVEGLPEQLERYLIDLYNKLSALKLTIRVGEEIPPIEASSGELIQRATAEFFSMLTRPQVQELDHNEKLKVKDFYKDYLIRGLAAIKNAFEESGNLSDYINNNRGSGLSEALNNITNELQEMFKKDPNIQYTQIYELADHIKQKLEKLLKAINEKKNN